MPVTDPPGKILDRLGVDAFELRTELDDAVENLTIALLAAPRHRRRLAQGRPPTVASRMRTAWSTGLDPDAQAVAFERLATEGHNLHPCGRTRLGWGRGRRARLRPGVARDRASAFVAIRSDLHVGDDIGALLRHTYPRCRPPTTATSCSRCTHGSWSTCCAAVRGPRSTTARCAKSATRCSSAVPTTALRTLLLRPDVRGAAALPEAVAGHPGHVDPAQHLGRQHPQRPGDQRHPAAADHRSPGAGAARGRRRRDDRHPGRGRDRPGRAEPAGSGHARSPFPARRCRPSRRSPAAPSSPRWSTGPG